MTHGVYHVQDRNHAHDRTRRVICGPTLIGRGVAGRSFMNALALRFSLALGFTLFLSAELVSTLNHILAHAAH